MAFEDITEWPDIRNWKTPEANQIGGASETTPACERRWKRIEIMASRDYHWLIDGEFVSLGCAIPHKEGL